MSTNMNGTTVNRFWIVFFAVKKKYPNWSNKKIAFVAKRLLAR